MINKELFSKISNIIDGFDYSAHKEYYLHNTKPGSEERSYCLGNTDGVIGYLLSQLSEDEQEEMKNFSGDDLMKILNRNEKYRMYGIQVSMDIQKEGNGRKKRGRWGL